MLHFIFSRIFRGKFEDFFKLILYHFWREIVFFFGFKQKWVLSWDFFILKPPRDQDGAKKKSKQFSRSGFLKQTHGKGFY